MKKITIWLLFLLAATTVFQVNAQFPVWNDTTSLPKWLTPEEMLRLDEIGKYHTTTPPPIAPVRNIAEFERKESILIRFPLGIPVALVAQMSQHVKILTLVGNTTIRTQAINTFTNGGVNMANVEFLIAPTDSFWTRDYGPWWIATSENQVAAIDFVYNRPRPNDDNIPVRVAQHLNVPLYSMSLRHAGGNYMCTGLGIAASTDLVTEENNNNLPFVMQQVQDYLGIHTYHITIDPLGLYIRHIDCWGKFLAPDVILIGQVAPTHNRFWAYEQVANYFANQISSYGTPFQVVRVHSPNLEPYTNSLIVNNRVYVPLVNSVNDAAAIATYQAAMPGYQIIGVLNPGPNPWQSTDALHCRVIGIHDRGMLYVKHIPLHGTQQFQSSIDIKADFIPYSGLALHTDSLFVIYSVNNSPFDTLQMINYSGPTYLGSIPLLPGDTAVAYYLFGADQSGRRENHPFIGLPDPHRFSVTIPANLVVTPDSLVFETLEQAVEGLLFTLTNPSAEENIILEHLDMFGSYVSVNPDAIPALPYTLAPGDSLSLSVHLSIVPAGNRQTVYVEDSISFATTHYDHLMRIFINEELLNRVKEPMRQFTDINIRPNPADKEFVLSFSLVKAGRVTAELFDLQGRAISTLIDGNFQRGASSVNVNLPDNLPGSGVYILRIVSGSEAKTKRLMIVQ